MSDIDTVIAKVVEDIWGTYDKDNSGALDKEETKQFVKDTLKEMADGYFSHEPQHRWTPVSERFGNRLGHTRISAHPLLTHLL